MRLWHQALLPKLPRQQLLGQHRECAALRGAGWGKRHATVNYVFDHNPYKLFLYHRLVMQEMEARGYKPDASWFDPKYRGKIAEPWEDRQLDDSYQTEGLIYAEHDDTYMQECLDNLLQKGIILVIEDGLQSGAYAHQK